MKTNCVLFIERWNTFVFETKPLLYGLRAFTVYSFEYPKESQLLNSFRGKFHFIILESCSSKLYKHKVLIYPYSKMPLHLFYVLIYYINIVYIF